MPCVGQTTSTKREATAVRRHDSETGLSRCCLFALLSRQGMWVTSGGKKKDRKKERKKNRGSLSSAVCVCARARLC